MFNVDAWRSEPPPAPATDADEFAALNEVYSGILSELSAADLALIDRVIFALGRPVVDRNGERIGIVSAAYVDRATAKPSWVGVHLPRTRREAFAGLPMAGLTIGGGHVWTYVEAELARAAPFVPFEFLSARAEWALCRHYRLPPTEGALGGRFERRATCSRITDRLADGTVVWLPTPREWRGRARHEQATASTTEYVHELDVADLRGGAA